MEELAALAESAGADVRAHVIQYRESAEAATLLGSGKVAELKQLCAFHEAHVAIFDAELTPTQLRNLEKQLEVRVIDRTQLILDIFAARARTREGQLQVELAQLNYLLPRLAGRGSAMSRLGGGIGTRGPGETQLETDRRKIARRIKIIEKNLETVRSGRTIQRRQRQGVPLATVAMAGYTNAGKSTLFNRLTGAQVVADARLFATLDPTVRHAILPSRRKVLLSDTVGFIRRLPTTLVKAFRATLEEVVEAKLILHVVDASSPEAPRQTEQVMQVLAEIDAAATPQIFVLNKADRLPEKPDAAAIAARLLSFAEEKTPRRAVCVSAMSGEGVPELLAAIDDALPLDPVAAARFLLAVGDGAPLNLLHECAQVTSVEYTERGCEVEAIAPESVRRRLSEYLISS
ncbi:MAG: GTPase HflX [Bryobacteraceae bacterium]|nr:GTPase HflX [Bryobacteraceae bacterium]